MTTNYFRISLITHGNIQNRELGPRSDHQVGRPSMLATLTSGWHGGPTYQNEELLQKQVNVAGKAAPISFYLSRVGQAPVLSQIHRFQSMRHFFNLNHFLSLLFRVCNFAVSFWLKLGIDHQLFHVLASFT
uniref:Uncharacterized protein n=1 Tax=Rhizophora mucronata TaxID=61149 RepID=A0A2P2PLP8_RHIMU